MRLPEEVLQTLKNRRTCRKCKTRNSHRVPRCRRCGADSVNFRSFRLQIRKS